MYLAQTLLYNKVMSKEEIKPTVEPEKILPNEDDQENPAFDHAEAVRFVEGHRDLFEHYARGRIKFAPAPPSLKTFAFDLKTNTIYINSTFFQKLGFSEEKTVFATLHEIEHFLEKMQLFSEKEGAEQFTKYLERIKESQAFNLMDNCLADIRENRAVVNKTHEGFRGIEQKCYREGLFEETDFRTEPKHLQFSYALLREARVPDEKCQVDESVREEIEKLKAFVGRDGSNLFEVMTDPETSMSVRLKLQDKYVWPVVKKLLEEDLKEEQEKKKEKGEGSGDGQKGNEAGEADQTEKEPGKGEKDQSGNQDEGGKEKPKGKGKNNDNKKGESGSKPEEGKSETGESKIDPNEIFKKAYDRAGQKFPQAMPIEEIKKVFEDWQKEQKEDPLEKADQAYADELGVTKEDLQNYRHLVESLNEVINPETNESVIEELRTLFSRIIAQRRKPQPAPQYPVVEGEDLVDPAQLVADVKAGNLEPKVWETLELKEKKGKRFGEVEITLICDRSTSMEKDNKKQEQLRAETMAQEALAEFAELSEAERTNLEKPLEIRSEIYSFQSDGDDSKPLKPMSAELGEKERVEICRKLSTTTGSTTDFVPLETIEENLTAESKKKILEGELKKIVIVFTDGGSDDPARVQAVLGKLRQAGVVVVGVGITESGQPALTTYAPGARLAETAEKLPLILDDLLKEHLADL